MNLPAMPSKITWIAIGIGAAAMLALMAWFYHLGKQSCAAEKAEAKVEVALQTQLMAERAGDLSLRVNDIGMRLRIDLHDLRTHGDAVVAEVTRDVDTATTLRDCTVPDRTAELRQQQVAQSAALAAGRKPVR